MPLDTRIELADGSTVELHTKVPKGEGKVDIELRSTSTGLQAVISAANGFRRIENIEVPNMTAGLLKQISFPEIAPTPLMTKSTALKTWLQAKDLANQGQHKKAHILFQNILINEMTNKAPYLIQAVASMASSSLEDNLILCHALIHQFAGIACIIELKTAEIHALVQYIKRYALNLFDLANQTMETANALNTYQSCIHLFKTLEQLIKRADEDFIQLHLSDIKKSHREIQFLFDVYTGKFNDVQNALLSYKELVNSVRGCHGFTPIIIAARADNYDLVELLIDYGADATAIDNGPNGTGENALHHATKNGKHRTMRLLANTSPDIQKQKNNSGLTVLDMAILSGNIDGAQILLECGATLENTIGFYLNILRKFGRTRPRLNPRMAAIFTKKTLPSVEQPTDAKRGIDAQSNMSNEDDFEVKDAQPLKEKILPLWQEDYEKGDGLIAEEKYPEAEVALQSALSHFKDSEFLIEQFSIYRTLGHVQLKQAKYSLAASTFKQANDIKTKIQNRPHSAALTSLPSKEEIDFLQASVECDALRAEDILKRAEAKYNRYQIVNARGQNNYTALLLTALHDDDKHFEFMRSLIEDMGASTKACNDAGQTVLHLAVLQGNLRNIGYLTELTHRVNINQRDEFGRTALHYAVENGLFSIVKTLLLRGADTSITDKNQQLARALTTNTAIIELFDAVKKDFNAGKLEEKETSARSSKRAIVKQAFQLLKSRIEPGSSEYYSHTDIFLSAEETLRMRVKHTNTDPKAILKLCYFYRLCEMHDKKRQLVLEGLARFPRDIQLLIEDGFSAKYLGNYKQAKDQFKDACALIESQLYSNQEKFKKWFIRAATGLIKIYWRENDDYAVRFWCDKIRTLDTKNIFAITTKASSLRKYGDHTGADILLSELANKNDPYVIIQNARILFHAGDLNEAILECKKITDQPRENYDKNNFRRCLHLLAQCYDALKDKNNAKENYKRLIHDYPKSYSALISHAIFMGKINRHDDDENVARFQKVINKFPCEDAYIQLARYYWYSNKYTDALQQYALTANLFPQSVRVHIELVECYMVNGLNKQAILHCEHFLGIEDHSRAINYSSDNDAQKNIFPNIHALHYVYMQALFAENRIADARRYGQACYQQFGYNKQILTRINEIFDQNNTSPLPAIGLEAEEKYPKSTIDGHLPDKQTDLDVTSSFEFPPLARATTSRLDIFKSAVVTHPEDVFDTAGIRHYFLTGEAEAAYDFLVEHNLDSKLFPPIAETKLTEIDVATNRDWIKSQLKQVDARVRNHRPVSCNEIYFIIAAKEVHQEQRQDQTLSNTFFSQLYKVIEKYKFNYQQLGFSPLNPGEIGLMGYVFSRANFEKNKRSVASITSVAVTQPSTVSSTMWANTKAKNTLTNTESAAKNVNPSKARKKR